MNEMEKADFVIDNDLDRRIIEAIDKTGINVAQSREIEKFGKAEQLKKYLLEEEGIEADVKVDGKTATVNITIYKANGVDLSDDPIEASALLPGLVGEKIARIISEEMPREVRLGDLDDFAQKLRDRLAQDLGDNYKDDIDISIDEETYEVAVRIDNLFDCVECKFELQPSAFTMPAMIRAIDFNSPRTSEELIMVSLDAEPEPTTKPENKPRRSGGMRR